MEKHIVALIAAAGQSSRFPGDVPKPYRTLAGHALIWHCLDAFLKHPEITGVQVMIGAEDRPLYDEAVQGLADTRLLSPIVGGESRQESIRLGLEAIAGDSPSFVLIHDGARPLVNRSIIDRVIQGLLESKSQNAGVIPALPVVDTLKKARKAGAPIIEKTIDRSHLWQAQTPQGFHFHHILSAHIECQDLNLTDDASVFEAMDLPVLLVEGDRRNIKITTPEDLEFAHTMLSPTNLTRTGMGYDVHAFSDEKSSGNVRLGGIDIPHDQALAGHSDADVVLHAITDALLGTMALGDIGTHFPPSDESYKDMDSAIFLEKALELVRNHGGEIINIDATIICEAPKIAPHRTKMAEHIAEVLDLMADQVSIKATTTEGLGFTGRAEGIATQAIVTVKVG